jgi:hypothetical protein
MQRENVGELLEAKTEECRLFAETTLEARAAEATLEAARAAAEGEAAALRARLGRLRYRAADRAARVVGKVPFLPGMIRSTAGLMISLIRKTG